MCGIHFLLQKIHFGESKTREKELKITIPENLDYTGIFDDLFENYTTSHQLMAVKTTNMGSMYDLTYYVEMEEEVEKKFIDEIRCRNGNLTVLLGRKDYNPLEVL